MAEAMAIVGIGASIVGGVTGAMGKEVEAKGQQLSIQGSMMQTIAKAFGMETEAKQYDYASQIADYQAAIATMNKNIALANANYELSTTDRKVEQSGMQTRYSLAMATAAQASTGIALDSKTSAGVRQSVIELGAYDQATIRADGARKAYAFDVEAAQAGAQADLYSYTSAVNTAQAADARTAEGMIMSTLPLQQQAYNLAGTAGTIGAIGSLVGAAGSVAGKWGDASKTFGWGT